LFVGDSAGQNLSHVGEGAIPSQICGRIAGSIAVQALKSKNSSVLKKYPATIKQTLGPLFDHCDSIREKIIETWTSALPADKRFLIGTILVSEIIPPNLTELLNKFEQMENTEVITEVTNFLKKQKLQVDINKF